jgi:hypothetical protein
MPLSNEAFARKMMNLLRRAGVKESLQYDPDQFAIMRGTGSRIFLSSIHQAYTQASFWRRGRLLGEFARSMREAQELEIPKSFDQARANLVPIVRNTSFLDICDLIARTSPKTDNRRPPAHFVPLAYSRHRDQSV